MMDFDLIAFVMDLGVSDVANGFPGWVPYLWVQFQHAALGFLAGAVSLVLAVPFFAAWTLKELILDNYANGGSLLVALDSVADLAIAAVGCVVIRLQVSRTEGPLQW